MANQYLLHLPDGTQYGPIDRATFEAWSREGRLPPETLVWPEGEPEWLPLEKALALPASTRPISAPPPDPARRCVRVLDSTGFLFPDMPCMNSVYRDNKASVH